MASDANVLACDAAKLGRPLRATRLGQAAVHFSAEHGGASRPRVLGRTPIRLAIGERCSKCIQNRANKIIVVAAHFDLVRKLKYLGAGVGRHNRPTGSKVIEQAHR
jgi:hypothetical protein